MASTIKLKNGSGAPLASDLVQAEPAFDLTNKRLYTEDASGTVIEVGINPSSLTTSSADINGGTIDGTVIGGSSAAAGSFTTISASGEIAANGGIALPDSQKATFGASDDLQIYHDGTASYIHDTGTGTLNIAASGSVRIRGYDTDDLLARFNENGSNQFYYDNAEKLATTSTGIDVTGTVTANRLVVDNYGYIQINRDGVSNAKIFWDRSGTQDASIELRSDESLYINNNFGNSIFLTTGASEVQRFRVSGGGDISFYENTGTTAKFFWDASAESLGIGTTSPKTQINVASATGSILTLESTDTTLSTNDVVGQINFYANDSSTNSTGNKAFIKAYSETDGGNKVALDFATSSSNSATGITAMTINSDGNVGIGTTSPTAYTNFTTLAVGDSVQGGVLEFQYAGAQAGRIATTAANTLTVTTNNAERMRIDSSGNLLVGKTTADNTTVGFTVYNDNGYSVVRDSNPLGIYNRLTTDGDLMVFRKDGSTVGSIGAKGGNIYLSQGSAGGIKASSSSEIVPCTNDGSGSDNTHDLGNSGARFKDLYLSGGVYLGGTGAANKLDDYEKGTWTVTLTDASSNASPTTVTGYYTKVGNKVTASFYTMLNIDTTGMTPSDALFISLPFTSGSTGAAVGAITHNGIDIGSRTQSNLRIANATDKALIQTTGSTLGSDTVSVSDISSGVDDITFATITYFTA